MDTISDQFENFKVDISRTSLLVSFVERSA